MLAVLAESALRSLILGGIVWAGLHLLRVRNPHIQMTAWTIVLLASLAMPVLMHWTTVAIPHAASPATPGAALGPEPATPFEPMLAMLSSPDVAQGGAVDVQHHAFDWLSLATLLYALVAAGLLLRLMIGLVLTWRLVRTSAPLTASWTARQNVRVSDRVDGPVTFGSVILLPANHDDWDAAKRQAVLAHEGAHVANRDFHRLLLASLNRALFWFSPFAWWQSRRLAELAEMISDARAIEALDDRLSYAQILLDFVQQVRPMPAGLQMARAATVRARLDRILDDDARPVAGGWRGRLCTAAAIAPVVLVAAIAIGDSAPSRSAAVSGGVESALAVTSKSEVVDFYSLGPGLILSVFRDGDALSAQLTWQRRIRLSADPDGMASYPAVAGPISWKLGDDPHPAALDLRHDGHNIRAVRIASSLHQRTMAEDASREPYLGWYELSATRVINVSLDGSRLALQDTAQSKSDLTPDGDDVFVASGGDLIVFLRDDQGRVIQALHQDVVNGARLAPRIDAVRARTIVDEAARRLAEAPDRFRAQTPMPGSKDAVLSGIADIQRGAPNYARMSDALVGKVRRLLPQIQPMLKTLGAVETIYFRGVGPGGYDIYGVKFANGSAEIRLAMAADGKVDDVIFRPDGDDTAGGIVACSEEARLASRGATAPISLFFYNNTGQDIRIYKLDGDGRRLARGTVGDDMSSTFWTTVGEPWIVADASGKCLEIVMPGQRTRFNTLDASVASGSPDRPIAWRTAPLAESEDMLRHYIEGVGRGQPDYARMTPEVAAQTRQQLLLDQAILTRLGAVRAMSFRGVSGSGNDIYMVHFANGTAEWRIGIAKEHTIGRIALGPQY